MIPTELEIMENIANTEETNDIHKSNNLWVRLKVWHERRLNNKFFNHACGLFLKKNKKCVQLIKTLEDGTTAAIEVKWISSK